MRTQLLSLPPCLPLSTSTVSVHRHTVTDHVYIPSVCPVLDCCRAKTGWNKPLPVSFTASHHCHACSRTRLYKYHAYCMLHCTTTHIARNSWVCSIQCLGTGGTFDGSGYADSNAMLFATFICAFTLPVVWHTSLPRDSCIVDVTVHVLLRDDSLPMSHN